VVVVIVENGKEYVNGVVITHTTITDTSDIFKSPELVLGVEDICILEY